ncbi:DUF2242 domain-containing protein [Pseudomonas sp. v388]|uniref:DUF2242 domain-containing protein n=1 Tax=Pseudomonas sp. v388 TaxID=2479849 RepID=UPI000F771D0C|nr:DUF2242 domain-containing protein [Pseudomonas sp. v388]RRV03493.1 DUF2242 domain-containing protein [Pseudomonas sp. v388]
MSNLLSFRTACWALALLAVAGCSSKKTAVYEHENFDDAGTFSRTYPVSDSASCEAARRALLSQGYIITSSDPKMISGNKSFQQTGETHMQISFNVVCAADDATGKSSTVFANALQDRYALKKTNNSASLGVGVLGSVSMPIGSTDDSMVKVASETVASDKFYDRFFMLVDNFMPPEAKKTAHIAEKPKADLGVPEAPKAAEPASLAPTQEGPAPKAEPAPQTPAPAANSEPMAAPAEPASFEAEPAVAPETEPAPAEEPTAQ